MKEQFVVTIGRQFGSGGRWIAIRLAELMGVNFYDRKLITEAAKRSGLMSEIIEQEDEKTPSTWTHAFTMGYTPTMTRESLFNIQSDLILDVAQKESCVIVGRCADYVLRQHPNCVNLFISAPLDVRVKRIMKRVDVEDKEARSMIEKIDKNRKNFYEFYSHKDWNSTDSYHLCIDSSLLGLEQTAQAIYSFVKRAMERSGGEEEFPCDNQHK